MIPLADKDTVTKEYMQDKATFADAFNFYLYGGEQVIKPEQLKPLDTAAIALPYGKDEKSVPTQKYRDVLKMVTAMTDDHAAYLILGIENQSKIHYAMPVRNMLYDSLQYSAQVDEIAKKHRKESDRAETSDEFLSGFYSTDKLLPVFTLTIYWGASEWTAPKDLHSMLAVEPDMLKFIDNYHLHLIAPAAIADDDFSKFHSELNAVLKFIKYSNDEHKLYRVIHDDSAYSDMSWETAEVISIVTGTDIPLNKTKKGRVDVCKAIENMKDHARIEGRNEGIAEGMTKGIAEGITKGIIDTLAGLVKDGIISLAEAAKRANMTVSEFEERTGLRA